MKSLLVLLLLLSVNNLSAQDSNQFLKSYNLSVLAGASISTIATISGSIYIEIKSPYKNNLYIKFSLGYTELNHTEPYEIKSNKYVAFNNYSKYQTFLYSVEKVNYSIVPITVGIEYFILRSKISPILVCDIGYNFSNAKSEGIYKIGVAGYYDLPDEIPLEYQNKAIPLNDGSSFRIGLGIGLNYNLTKATSISIMYIYRYNKVIINNMEILLGITF